MRSQLRGRFSTPEWRQTKYKIQAVQWSDQKTKCALEEEPDEEQEDEEQKEVELVEELEVGKDEMRR